MMNAQDDNSKLLIFLDYEGTIATSRRRHYAQYVEALRRIRNRLALDHNMLYPVSEEIFLARYDEIKDVSEMLEVNTGTFEGTVAQRLLKHVHSEVIWEYNPEYMKLEQLTPSAENGLIEVATHAHGLIVSYTRQPTNEFVAHLCRMKVVGPGRLDENDIHTVGSDGKKSREAKAAAIHAMYANEIRLQQARGGLPTLIGDSVDDMLAARDCNLHFIGVTETGKSSKLDFESAIREEDRDKISFCARFGDADSTAMIRSRVSGFTHNKN